MFDPDTRTSGFEGSCVLVPWGLCSFESKAQSVQRHGSSGVLVCNTLASRYGLVDEGADVVDGDTTTGPDWSNTRWPINTYNYACGACKARGGFGHRAKVDLSVLDFDPPPTAAGPMGPNDGLLSGPAADGNLCALEADGGFKSRSPSRKCLLTGRNGTSDAGRLKVCCGWEKLQIMGSNGDNNGDAIPTGNKEAIIIPALFVSMERGEMAIPACAVLDLLSKTAKNKMWQSDPQAPPLLVMQFTPLNGSLVDTDKRDADRQNQSGTHTSLFLFSLLFYSQIISVLTCFLAT